MQPGQPLAARVHHPRHQRGAVGAEDRLRRLDLDLEAQVRGRAVSSTRSVHHRLDLVDAGHLGQRHHPAVEAPAVLQQGRDVRRQRPDRPAPGRRLEALDPDAAERRRRARLLALGQRRRGPRRRRRPRRRRSCRRSRPRSRPAGPRPARRPSLARTRATTSSSRHERGERVGVLVEHRRARPRRTPAPGRRRTGPRARTPCAPAAAPAAPRGTRAPAPRPRPPAARPARRSVGRRARRGRPCGPSNYTHLERTCPSQSASPSLRFAVRPDHPSGDGSAFSEWRNK